MKVDVLILTKNPNKIRPKLLEVLNGAKNVQQNGLLCLIMMLKFLKIGLILFQNT
jgi:hypothetical protein